MPSRSISLYSLCFSHPAVLLFTCLVYAKPSSLNLSFIVCLGQLRVTRQHPILKSDHTDAGEQTGGHP